MEVIKISSRIYKKDYIRIHFHLLFKEKRFWILLVCWLVVFIPFGKDLIWPIPLALAAVLVYLFYRYFLVIKLLKTIDDGESMDLVIDTSGITVSIRETPFAISFPEVVSLSEIKQFFYVVTNRNEVLIIPKSGLQDEQLSILRNLLTSVVKKPSHNELVKAKIKPVPYTVGLACLIPGVGGLLGVIWLFIGVKYRDRWLMLIGVGGVAFTVLFLLFFNNVQILNTAVAENQFLNKERVVMSQQTLNKIVAKIEAYRIKNGKYPELLEELKYYAGEKAPIEDPVHFGKSGRYPFYYYKQVGDKYVLFSSGTDGVPKTNDDLHPQIDEFQRSQTGLLSPE